MKNLSKILNYSSRILLIIISVFWFVFALLSGAEEYGGGIKGILKNSPNALPWLILFFFVFLAWKKKLIGGIVILLIAVFTLFMFDHPTALLLISLPLLISGGLLIVSHYLKN
jgi:hypothetical protein